MTHLTEEDFILHYYAETQDPGPVEKHLDACAECRATYGSLKRILNLMDGVPVPERAAGYEAEVWRRLRASGIKTRIWRKPFVRWPAVALAAASLLVAAVLIRRPAPQPVVNKAQTQTRLAAVAYQKQILDFAVGDYLDRSEIVLTELANASPAHTLDISVDQELASDLLAECRLYHQTAVRADDASVAGVLDALERVLLEITHSPSRLAPSQVKELQQRLRSQGVLFRIRDLSSNVRSEAEPKL
jgi:hypothetical protein